MPASTPFIFLKKFSGLLSSISRIISVICSFVAIGVSVFSWLLFYLFLSIPAMIGAIILNVKAKREGAPQNIVTISKIAMIVTIVMASLQLLFAILIVALGLSGNL